jgi:8-oxo-dGTP diphosphatase
MQNIIVMRDAKFVKRHLHVACAIIENNGTVLAAQRSALMSLPLKWEFPGGKIEACESPMECLIREVSEELGVSVSVSMALTPTTHNYPDFTVTLYPFTCKLTGGNMTHHEHQAIRWIEPLNMPELDWAAADLPVVFEYLSMVKPLTLLYDS